MSLTKRQDQQLQKIIKLVEAFRREAGKTTPMARSSGRKRRSRADAQKMRRDILAARAKGVSVAKLAEKHGVSSAYIYMIKE